jgi:hypothetical protein
MNDRVGAYDGWILDERVEQYGGRVWFNYRYYINTFMYDLKRKKARSKESRI